MARITGNKDRGAYADVIAKVEGASAAGIDTGLGNGGGSPAPAPASGSQEETEDPSLSLTFHDLEAPDELPPVDSPAPQRRLRSRTGRKRRSDAGIRKPSSTAPRPAQKTAPTLDAEAASVLLAMLEGGLMMGIGPRAQLLPFERSMIEPPLGRILRRMTPEAAVKVAALADPLMLGVGILVYASRVFVARGSSNGATIPAPSPSSSPIGTRQPDGPTAASSHPRANGTGGLSGVRPVPSDLHETLGGGI